MCGRFSLSISWNEICGRYGIPLDIPLDWSPRYNIAPNQDCITIVKQDSLLHGKKMRWGLVPHWSKDSKIGYRMINARAETVDEKPSYRKPFSTRRCLIPADSFYEWQVVEGKKMPVRIMLKSREIFSFAGLWDEWVDPKTHESVETFTIITTSSNTLIRPVHDRMPVILDPSTEELWLNASASKEGLKKLLVPYSSESMFTYPVVPLVNSWKNEGPECVEERQH